MSKTMTTCLWFDKGEARNAAEFYASVFPDIVFGILGMAGIMAVAIYAAWFFYLIVTIDD